MGTYNCQVVNCGRVFSDLRSLNVHMARKHSAVKTVIKRVEITADKNEFEMWQKDATNHNFSNLATYIKTLIRKGTKEAEHQMREEIENQYKSKITRIESEKAKIERELEAMKKFFVQHMTGKKQKPKIDSERATLWMLEHCKGFDKELFRLEEQHMESKLIREEWESLTPSQQLEATELMDDKKISIVKAIKSVSECSEDFERFFSKELSA